TLSAKWKKRMNIPFFIENTSNAWNMLEQGFEIPLRISWIYATKFVTLWLFCEIELAKKSLYAEPKL
ncbi:MAG: hypothetical protein II415_06145, partial [Bacteroidaceae bacterium]|nr:hypothetical protein [Bacteroidaceae bacterium]